MDTRPLGSDPHPEGRTRLVGRTAHMRLSVTDGVLVLEPLGVVDGRSAAAIERLLSEFDAPVVIDLHRFTTGDRGNLDWIDPARWGRSRGAVCIACDRMDPLRVCPGCDRTGPRATCAAVGGLAVFRHTADAIQAHVMADHGYGTGWT